MELSDLAIFAAVAKCGSITRAAAQVNTVQSKVTARVQALEEEICVALFERHSRGVTLTAAGKRLLPYAERLASMSREAILAARDDGIPKVARLRLAGEAGDRPDCVAVGAGEHDPSSQTTFAGVLRSPTSRSRRARSSDLTMMSVFIPTA